MGAYAELADDAVEVWDGVLPWGAEGDPRWSVTEEPGRHVERALDEVPGGVDVVVVHSFTAGPALEVLARRGTSGPLLSSPPSTGAPPTPSPGTTPSTT